MKWVNHIAIAGATTALIAPPLVPLAILGSTAPDWLEWVLKATGQKIKHRTVTHYVTTWVAGILFFYLIWDFQNIGLAFCYGGLTHVITDSFTITGVPFSPLSDRRFHLFGGRLRTGSSGEYIVAGLIVITCFAIAVMIKPGNGSSGWYPFFYDWQSKYESGMIDAKEWKDKRFNFL
ncbi:MAG: metal-dependent hydrolase [Pseudoalteromonas tetraodonis]|nr:metal-dependent hydrolase [Pseudoalteromonas tetraodonis]